MTFFPEPQFISTLCVWEVW